MSIIAIEGPDKSGKRTHTTLLTKSFVSLGCSAKRIEVPFKDGTFHTIIYWMLRNGLAKRLPNLFQFIQFMNKFVFQWTYLLYCRLAYDYVVLDRWALSSIVYGDAGGANKAFTRFLYLFLVKPDLTFVMSGTSYDRDTIDDVYERDVDLQRAVRHGYVDWALDNPDDHVVLNNVGTKNEVATKIWATVMLHVLDQRRGTSL